MNNIRTLLEDRDMLQRKLQKLAEFRDDFDKYAVHKGYEDECTVYVQGDIDYYTFGTHLHIPREVISNAVRDDIELVVKALAVIDSKIEHLNNALSQLEE